jgi:hypothetical protein
MGPIASTEDIRKKYGVDEVCFTDEIERVMTGKNPSLLLTLSGVIFFQLL